MHEAHSTYARGAQVGHSYAQAEPFDLYGF